MPDTIIKPEPEDPEDLIMSYLNADYLTTETPLSPCSSDTLSPPSDPNLFSSAPFNPQLDCWPQLQQDPLLTFPFLLPLNSTPFPPLIEPYTQPSPPSSASSTSSLSDSDQPKKKRGRKKRDNNQTQMVAASAPPKPLAPRPLSTPPIKIEPVLNAETQQKPKVPSPSQEAQKAAQLAKRQERLIKNRAAALLSRKRKREHLTSLEEDKRQLALEKDALQQKVEQLENRIQTLEKENSELKQKLQSSTIKTTDNVTSASIKHALPKNSKATGVVFMIMLFSFALFTLPSRTIDQLTVGGSIAPIPKQYPMLPATVSNPVELDCQQPDCKPHSTDLVLIDSVRPRDLQTWIQHKLPVEEVTHPSLYLYANEFSQIASMSETTSHDEPILSLVSPFQTNSNRSDTKNQYLQIDVQVLRSRVINGVLTSFEQCDSNMIESIQNELLRPTNITRTRRRKAIDAGRTSRVIH